MINDNWLKNQMQTLRSMLRESRQLVAQKKLRKAFDMLAEARRLVESAEEEPPEVIELKVAVYAELALLHQRMKDARQSLSFHEMAEEQSRRLPLESERGDRYRMQLATTLINMTGLLSQQRMYDRGLEKSAEALELLEGLSGKAGQAAQLLRLGGLQNRSTLLLANRDLEGAEAALREAVELGGSLVSTTPQLLPQVIDVTGRLVGILRRQKRLDEALELADRAGRWAEAAYNGGLPMAPQLYAGTQLQLVDVNFARGQYAAAEDHLWKAVEIGNDPRTLTIAAGFYFVLVRRSDEELEAGDLPRDEIRDAITELFGKLEERQAPEELMQLLRAREAALLDDDVLTAERLEREVQVSGSEMPALKQLLPLLRRDIDWVRSGRPAQSLADAEAGLSADPSSGEKE